MPNPIRIILVDDHDLVREAWRTLLEKDSKYNIIADCKNGADAIKQANALIPDVILMDVNMSPVNGFEATEKIMQTTPSIKIIGVSVNNNPRYAQKMLAHGAKGFVTKTSAFEELKTAIQKVYDGEEYICKEILNRLN